MTDKKKFKEPNITISKVYTRTGDLGETGLVGGQRLYKDDIRIEAYGEVDELNTVIGGCKHEIDLKLDTATATTTYAPKTGVSTITTVGSLVAGSIGGNFGNIDIGDNAIKAASLSIGSVVASGATVGHKDNLDLITLSSGAVDIDGDLYASPPDSGYSLDNLSPAVPDSMIAFVGYSNGSLVDLSWSQPLEEDFQYFSIFRDDELVTYAIESTYTDIPSSQNSEVAYHVTATDIHGNESEPSESITVQLAVAMHNALNASSNLKSFYVQPENASIATLFSPLIGQLDAVLGEGVAALYMDELGWVGALQDIDVKSGYWLNMSEEVDDFSFYGYIVDSNMEYSLHAGSNLISFPSNGSVDISYGIPDSLEDQF